MRKNVVVFSLAVVLAMLVASPAVFAADHWLGTWKLNVAASKFSAGPAPKSQTLKFEATEGGIKLSSQIVDAEGKTTEGGYVSKFDGQDVPWAGNPNADMSSAKRIDANHYENAWKKGGKVTVMSKVAVSADGKTLTIHQTGTDAEGKTVDNMLVFDRQ